MEITTNVAIGILTNTIYDCAKYIAIKLGNRPKEKELRALIENEIQSRYPEDLNQLFESSTFVSYFNTPQFLDVMNAYIEHKLVCDYTYENARVQKYVKKSGTISPGDVVKYICDNIDSLYTSHEVLLPPSKGNIERAVKYILSVAEQVVAKNLSPDNARLLFLLNSRIDKHQEEVISLLSKLQSSVDQIQAKNLSPTNSEYEEIRLKYHSILKEKNSVAHIYLLDKFPFEKFYVPPILHRSTAGREDINLYRYREFAQSPTSWNDIFSQGNIVYLTGGAGYGKSLFTKKIINDYKELNVFRAEEYLVVCGELKSFYPTGSDSTVSVIEFLRASIRSNTLMDVSAGFVEHYLNAGRCIVLLDALDEVDKTKRVSLHESVVAFFKNQNPNNMICITSRDRGFIPERNVEVLKICPLNEDQIDKYVNKIIALGKFEEQDKETFMKQSKILVDKGFLSSFLVLSLLINIYKAELELPENKLELYQKCFEYIANKREKDKTQQEFDWRAISPIMKDNTFIELSRMGCPNNSNIDRKDIKDRLLQVYKTKYGSEAEAENAIDEFLKFCSDRTELFVPTAEDNFKFFHRSFFEYFYSFYIFLRCMDENEMLEEFLKFDVDSEVFELTVAMLKQKSEIKYQALIELMFKKSEEELLSDSDDFSVFNILILTMQVIDDALYRRRFLDIIVSNRKRILKHIENIHNLKLIATIYESDDEANQKICECYNDDGILYLLENCDRLFAFAQEYEKETNEKFFERLFDKRETFMFRRRFVYHYVDEDEIFYMPILSRALDFKKILLALDDEALMRLIKKICPRDYKRRAAQTKESLEKFRAFSNQEQEKVIEHMLLPMQLC